MYQISFVDISDMILGVFVLRSLITFEREKRSTISLDLILHILISLYLSVIGIWLSVILFDVLKLTSNFLYAFLQVEQSEFEDNLYI